MHIQGRYRNGIARRLPCKAVVHCRPCAGQTCGRKKNQRVEQNFTHDHSSATLFLTAVTCMFVPMYIIQFFFPPPVPKMVPPCGVQALTIDHSITNAAAQKFVKRKSPETIRARVEIMNLEGQAFCLARQTYTTDRPNFRSTSLNELH